jgi:DNA-binding LytR/AlgR family response regulator
MMSIAIIEDDPISAEALVALLSELDDPINIKAVLGSVKESIHFLKSNPDMDLILSDIQLTDGLSFSIFEAVAVNCPIIFVSAYDKYIVNAFEFSGIDYLVKPVSKEVLRNSIRKYKALEKHFIGNNNMVKNFLQDHFLNKKTRIIVKKGLTNISLNLTDVVLFYTESLVVYVLDSKGNKYIVDKSLNSLENELDPKLFFRANRQYIVNINYVQGYKTYERVKLLLSLTMKEIDHLVVVGQEKARAFRQWLSES